MKRAVLLVVFVVATMGFTVLGIWQIERRAWKLDLIAKVDSRVHAPPVAMSALSATSDDEYRHVELRGHYLNDPTTLVDALTDNGAGAWVMTPLATHDGIVLINRGFVPKGHENEIEPADGELAVTGLLRMTEPGGRFLRANRPQDDAWYSRDVAAIAQARRLGDVAPFFVDADAIPGIRYPIGGMTVVHFRNMHLTYALTWFALAILSAAGAWRLIRPKPKPAAMSDF